MADVVRREPPSRERLVAIYLRHHVAASRGGVALFDRVARTVSTAKARQEVARLAREVSEDRKALLGVMTSLGVRRHPLNEKLVSWGEKVGRLKPNGTLLQRSPLTDVVELEALGVAVHAKQLGWLTLRELRGMEPRLKGYAFDLLVERAQDQERRIEVLRLEAVRRVLGARQSDISPSQNGPSGHGHS
jgi:hypothetical protein